MVAWNRVSTNRDDTQDMFWYGWDITQIKYKVRNEGLGFNVISMSVQLFVSDSLRPHGLKHARFPCPSPTPRAYSNSCPLSRWCHPTISSSVVPFSSHLQSFPASGSFPVIQLFPWYMVYNGIYVKEYWTLSSISNSWTLSENFIWLFFPVYGSYFFLSLHLSLLLTIHSK